MPENGSSVNRQDLQERERIAEARRQQAEIVALVRERGFKEGGKAFTDAQIWQAVIDSKEWEAHAWDAAAGKLLEHVIEGRTPPSSPTYRPLDPPCQ